VDWGVDKQWLCPEDSVTAHSCTAHSGGPVRFDSGFKFDDNPSKSHVFESTAVDSVPSSGVEIGSGVTVSDDGDLGLVHVEIAGGPGGSPVDYEVALDVDGTEAAAAAFTSTPLGTVANVAMAVTVVAGAVISVRIRPSTGAVTRAPGWSAMRITVQQSAAQPWRFDEPLPAGDFCNERAL
jgi:hypothetical protein